MSGDGRLMPPTGRCHRCERPVTGDRRFCGSCVVARERERIEQRKLARRAKKAAS